MKRTELKRKTGLKSKRALPRRDEGRVRHVRIRPRPAAPADEKRHLARIAKLPCIICRKPGPSTVHHVRHKITRSGTFARVDYRIVPLCPPCHFHGHGDECVEKLHEAGIYARFGIDLWAEAERLWEESCELA